MFPGATGLSSSSNKWTDGQIAVVDFERLNVEASTDDDLVAVSGRIKNVLNDGVLGVVSDVPQVGAIGLRDRVWVLKKFQLR